MRAPTRQGDALYLLLSLLLPAAVLLIAYLLLGVYPFGEKSLLLVDMNSEYIDYFAHLNRSVREGGSFMRSWNMGMGLNMMGLIAFYTASPLNLILLTAPMNYLTEAVLVLTLLKVGMCGLTMYLYVRSVFGQAVVRPVLLAASVAWGLCGYNMAYSSNIMWLDGVACLPLVCLGVEQLMGQRKPWLLFLSLSWSFWCSYYIGYMIGVFSLLYFTTIYFCRARSLRGYLQCLLRFLGAAALAAVCCAVLLLPAFLELKSGQAQMWNIDLSWKLGLSMTRMASKLLPGVYDSLTDAGLPNIYTTVWAALGTVLFFLGPASRREKLVAGSLSVFLLLSMSCEILDLAWHAFEDPTWFPVRYSFVASFWLLYLALRGLQLQKKGEKVPVWLGAGLLCTLFVEIGLQGLRFVPPRSVLLGIGLSLLYALCQRLHQQGCHKKTALLMLLLVCSEVGYNATAMVQGMDRQFGYRTRSSYYEYRDTWLPAVQRAEESVEEYGRMEVARLRNANGGMALGYRGISHYSTTTDQQLNTFLRSLGYNTGTINELRYASAPPLTGGLLGIQRVLSEDDLGEGYALQGEVGTVGIYRNLSAFPLAFAADNHVAGQSLSVGEDPFLFQNQLLGALADEERREAFIPLQITGETLQNLQREEAARPTWSRLDLNAPGILELEIANPTGRPAWAWLPVYGKRTLRATAHVDGEEQGRNLAYRNNAPIALGSGERVILRIEVETGQLVQLQDIYLYALDLEISQTAADAAWQSAVQFEQFTDTRVSGTVTVTRDQLLVTTFPVDDGWRVYLDGRRVETTAWLGVFLAVELPAGEHHLEWRYTAPGIVAGSCISVAGISLALWYLWKQRHRSR